MPVFVVIVGVAGAVKARAKACGSIDRLIVANAAATGVTVDMLDASSNESIVGATFLTVNLPRPVASPPSLSVTFQRTTCTPTSVRGFLTGSGV